MPEGLVASAPPFAFCTSTVLYGAQSLDRACAEIASLRTFSGTPFGASSGSPAGSAAPPAARCTAVDLWHVPGWCEHLAGGVEGVAATLGQRGLRLEAISAFGAGVEALDRLLTALIALGGHALVTGSPPAEVPVATFARQIRPLVERATAAGVCLAIENHGRATIDSIESMEELATLLPATGLGLALAPIHLWMRGEETAAAIERLRGRIGLMYLWDWGPTAVADWKDPQEQFLGTGRIDYAPIAAALRAVRYDRPLCLFAHGPEHWPPQRTTAELGAALRRAAALFG